MRKKLKEYSFISPDPTLQRNVMSFGFEVGDGWMDLLEELFDKMQKIIDNDSQCNAIEVVQVKEKFGELRVYTNYDTDEIFNLIEEYTRKSKHICEWCGKKGKLRNDNGWYTTLCNKCHEKRLESMQ